ncbi:uracil-DNA glycosylase [Marinimicrobium sp. C2-29]|uniref:uracil-DNA glycosylase n=1 Tax=Marinimicrobium sp. C2-29 TaxID=3139825 RepID=UPI003138ED81
MANAQKNIDLEPGWLSALEPEFQQSYMQKLKEFLRSEKQQGKVIYPASKNIFNAFNSAPLDRVKVVVLGQDPYHGPGQAHGLCFSVQPGVAPPPSLKNMFKELNRDLGCPIPAHGYLQSWADQGVLLLNATLTVEQGQAGSHQRQGWEPFTDRAIEVLNRERDGLVFMLWGSYAQKKAQLLDSSRHLILKSSHPSPLSAHRGFLGCGHFSTANDYLRDRGETPIQWCLPEKP